MARDQRNEQHLPFYPAYCFRASPTHFTWVKITAADIQRLKSRREFEGWLVFTVLAFFLLLVLYCYGVGKGEKSVLGSDYFCAPVALF
jgi:hypothetical protein